MVTLHVEELVFEFTEGWLAEKCDDWTFYRDKFERMGNNIKCLDILAISPQKVAYLIEAKDYRRHKREKPSDLIDEMCMKLVGTLAMLLPGKLNSTVVSEKALCSAILNATEMHIVLHMELPPPSRRLDPVNGDSARIKMKMRERFKAICPYPKVANMDKMVGLGWTVRESAS